MKRMTNMIYAALAIASLAIGTVTVNGALSDLFASVDGDTQNDGGFIYEYNPGGGQSTFAGLGNYFLEAVVIDHSDNAIGLDHNDPVKRA